LGLRKYFLENSKSFPDLFGEYLKKACLMYISLKDSCAKGFNKWANARQPEIKNDLRESGGNGLGAASPDQDNAVMTSLRAAASSMARAGRGDALI
jgi:hypothetical protein